MDRFTPADLEPIQKALAGYPDGAQDAALVKACNLAEQAQRRLEKGESILAHPEADQLTKAVLGAVDAMHKRKKGTPLSDAELKQRQEAGKKKKGGAAAGAATGAVAGAVLGLTHGPGAKARGAAALAESAARRAGTNAANGLRVASPFTPSLGAAGASGGARSFVPEILPTGTKAGVRGRSIIPGVATRGDKQRAAMASAAKGLEGRAAATGRSAYAGVMNQARRRMGGRGAVLGAALGAGAAYASSYFGKGEVAEDLRKAMDTLPLSQRGVAEAMARDGRDEDLRKFLGPALMAVRAAMPLVARYGAAAGARMFGGARAGAALRAARTAGTALKGGARTAGAALKGGARSMAGTVAGGAAVEGAMAGAEKMASWGKKHRRKIGVAAGGLAAGAAAGYAAAPRKPKAPTF